MTGESYPALKRCGGCREEKPLDAFYRDASKASGRASQCKMCKERYNARWHAENPDYRRRYRESHREYFAAASRKWTREHPDYHRQYRAEHPRATKGGKVGRPPGSAFTPEELVLRRREQHRQYRERKHGIILVRDRNRRQLHGEDPAKKAARRRRWEEANRETLRVVKAIRQRVRAHKIRAQDGQFSSAEWEALCTRYGNICLRCGAAGVPLTVDHVVPISKGGTNWITDVQPLCKPCNSWKGTKTIDFRPDSAAQQAISPRPFQLRFEL